MSDHDQLLVALVSWLAKPDSERLRADLARAVASGMGCPQAAPDYARRLADVAAGKAA